jgi:hypothetical protein
MGIMTLPLGCWAGNETRSSPENLLVPERISSKILVVNTVQNLAENSENSCNTENSCNWYDYFI